MGGRAGGRDPPSRLTRSLHAKESRAPWRTGSDRDARRPDGLHAARRRDGGLGLGPPVVRLQPLRPPAPGGRPGAPGPRRGRPTSPTNPRNPGRNGMPDPVPLSQPDRAGHVHASRARTIELPDQQRAERDPRLRASTPPGTSSSTRPTSGEAVVAGRYQISKNSPEMRAALADRRGPPDPLRPLGPPADDDDHRHATRPPRTSRTASASIPTSASRSRPAATRSRPG